MNSNELNSNNLLSYFSDYVIAHAICEACGEEPMHKGDCNGNDFRWQDYLNCVPQFRQSMNYYFESVANAKRRDDANE